MLSRSLATIVREPRVRGVLSYIFDPFFTTRPEGMGRLWAENNPERGASFHFVVPRADAAP